MADRKQPDAEEIDLLADAGGFVCRPVGSLPAKLQRAPVRPAAADGDYDIFKC